MIIQESHAPVTDELIRNLVAERDLGHAMLAGYRQARATDFDRYEILAVEKEFCLPIRNPASERASRFWDRGGVIDLVVRDRADGRVLIVDHKTYARQTWSEMERVLAIDDQCAGYLSAWRTVSGAPADGFCWNVLIKDFPKPVRLVKPKSKDDACPCGKGEPHVLSTAKDQATTHALFLAAMVEHGLSAYDPRYAELLAQLERFPREYFARLSVARTADDLVDWEADLYAMSKEIRENPSTRKHVTGMVCPRCEFLSLCLADTPEARSTFVVSDATNDELEETPRPGKDVLSHSRVACYAQCRRRHHYRYIERLRTTTEHRALRFGSGIHFALAEGYRARDFGALAPAWEKWWSEEFRRLTGETYSSSATVHF